MKSTSDINKENSHKNKFKSNAPAMSFSRQQVSLSKTPFFFPSGFENIFAGLYFIFLPYVTGIIFMFIVIAKGSFGIFQSLSSESSFLFSWCVGYECLAGLALLWIIKGAITFSVQNKAASKEFIRPGI